MARKQKTLRQNVESQVVMAKSAVEGKKSLKDKVERQKVDKGLKAKNYIMDLRIHSPASFGYLAVEGIDTAPALVRLAKVKGLDVIAITDFYSGAFIDKIATAAKDTSVTIIPGVVIRCVIDSCDDVVLLCLFNESFTSSDVSKFLSKLKVPESAAGDKNFIIRLPFLEVLQIIESFEGVAIPSRMDKTPHRVMAIPALVEKYGFRAFDMAYGDSSRYFRSRWPKIKFQIFSFSNAHALAQVGSRIAKVKLVQPGFTGIKELVNRESRV